MALKGIAQRLALDYGGTYVYNSPAHMVVIDDIVIVIGRDYRWGTWSGRFYVHGYVDSRFSGMGHSVGCEDVKEIYPAAVRVIGKLRERAG